MDNVDQKFVDYRNRLMALLLDTGEQPDEIKADYSSCSAG